VVKNRLNSVGTLLVAANIDEVGLD